MESCYKIIQISNVFFIFHDSVNEFRERNQEKKKHFMDSTKSLINLLITEIFTEKKIV